MRFCAAGLYGGGVGVDDFPILRSNLAHDQAHKFDGEKHAPGGGHVRFGGAGGREMTALPALKARLAKQYDGIWKRDGDSCGGETRERRQSFIRK